MKAIHWIIAVAALAFVQPAQAGINDPEVIIYRFPGVREGQGIATVFFCTNFSGVTENIRFVTRFSNGTLSQNQVFPVAHLATLAVATHDTNAYLIEQLLTIMASALQGTTAIAATSINIICTAETIDASTAVPIGVARRGIRFAPVPGSQE